MTIDARDYPCHGCQPPQRQPGCHGRCEAFLERKRYDDERLKQQKDNFSLDRVLYGNIKRR